MFAARAPPCALLMQALPRAHAPHQRCARVPALARRHRRLPLRSRARCADAAVCSDEAAKPPLPHDAAATEAFAVTSANTSPAAPLLHFSPGKPRVLVFVSRDSGPQSGGALAERLRDALGASQVRV
jgi:hypothetical protein